MEPRISLVTLGVADVARSRAFYEALGWKASGLSMPEIAFFQLGTLALGLWSAEALAAECGAGSPPAPGGITLAQNLGSRAAVDALLAEAERAGGTTVVPGTERPWGYVGYFADPDGHRWEAAFVPSIPMDPEGRLVLPE